MKIEYMSDDKFYDGILALVERGLTFYANYHTLTITLTGGY